MENEPRFVFESGCLDFVRRLAVAVCNESQLQNRVFTRCPATQDCLNARHWFAVFVRDLFVPDSLRQFPELIETLRAAFAVTSATPVGVGAASQPLIPTDEQPGLLTRIVATDGVSLCMRIKS
jgi:hypothetical protein